MTKSPVRAQAPAGDFLYRLMMNILFMLEQQHLMALDSSWNGTCSNTA